MHRIGEMTSKVRSKNAGPFVLTIDLFCDTRKNFQTLCAALPTERVAALYNLPGDQIKRFELTKLNVLKFSMPRPTVQGSLEDRDMHAAQWGWLLAELMLKS